MANENPYLTITLTGRPPVKINKEDWPMLAAADDNDRHGAQIGNQPNRETTCSIKVRGHKDGRTIVYAIYRYDTRYQEEKGLHLRGGELLENNKDIPEAIDRIAQLMAARLPSDDDAAVFLRLAEECIADLPAVEI